MKKFKTNKFQQANNEIEALDKGLSVNIPTEISEKEKGHYHVALVKIKDRPGEVKNEVKVSVQTFSKISFLKLERNFKFLGYTKIIIVHDPNAVSELADNQDEDEDKKVINLTNTPPAKTEAEIEAEIEKRANEKANEILKTQQAGQQASTTTQNDGSESLDDKGDNSSDEEKKEIETPDFGSTVEQMKEFAEKNDVDLTGLRKKDEIQTALTSWFNDLTIEQKQTL